MRTLPKSTDKRLIVGPADFSDAGIFQVAPDLLLVQSLDFFAPLVDDPYVFGQIAAANSLSDVFAMGGSPITAQNIVCFPDDQLDLEVLTEILRGGADKVHEAGASIVGGHSIRDNEIKYGLSVTGIVSPDQLLTNANAQPGDVLVLTKRLGTGFITTAMKSKKCSSESEQTALKSMASLNRVASDAAKRFGANAATDITGFGLAVHACELAQASDVSLDIRLTDLPLLPDALDLARKGFITRANETNREFCSSWLSLSDDADPLLLQMMFDPQTSGGLLISVPENESQAMLDWINEQESGAAVIVGAVQEKQNHSLRII